MRGFIVIFLYMLVTYFDHIQPLKYSLLCSLPPSPCFYLYSKLISLWNIHMFIQRTLNSSPFTNLLFLPPTGSPYQILHILCSYSFVFRSRFYTLEKSGNICHYESDCFIPNNGHRSNIFPKIQNSNLIYGLIILYCIYVKYFLYPFICL
jgi:hypothetical protein